MKNETLITIRNLTHSFGKNETKHTVLHDVDLDFCFGEIVIVMGPSGAGKTTLLTLVGALRAPQAGSVVVCGTELRNATVPQQLEVRQRIGFIFQAHNLLDSLTVCENVQMGLAHLAVSHAESKQRAMAMLQRVGLVDHINKRLQQLSIGQRQRVAIARALVRRPLIIIADEPTASLDSQTGREVVELLDSLSREDKCLVLIVTHDTRILDIADRILTLEDGHIDESNRIIERTRTELIRIVERIAQYPAHFAAAKSNDEVDESVQEVRKRLNEAHRIIMTLGSRKLKASLSEKFKYLDRACENLLQIEEAVNHFCMQIKEPPSELVASQTDFLFQSMEFLLITTAETLKSGIEEDITQLLLLTEDRSDLMEKLRKNYIAAEQASSQEERNFVFNVTQSFVLAVHFLHALADVWK